MNKYYHEVEWHFPDSSSDVPSPFRDNERDDPGTVSVPWYRDYDPEDPDDPEVPIIF